MNLGFRRVCFLSVLIELLSCMFASAQHTNPSVFPFGGIQRSNGGLNFAKRANFFNVRFEGAPQFTFAEFDSSVSFWSAHFDGFVNFQFARFKSEVIFVEALFDSTAYFRFTTFDSVVYFGGLQVTHFERAYSGGAIFNDDTNFESAYFKSAARFDDVRFNGKTDFRYTRFDSLFFVRTVINDKFLLGSPEGQLFDFTRTIFLPDAQLELHELVELKIQPEKFKYIVLADTLSYFRKWDIIENLKSASFSNDKGAQFELDYIFAKSTLYQDQVDTHKRNHWSQIHKWPKWVGNTIYYLTMGLGYRPFRLIWWVLAIVLFYTLVYQVKMAERINAYIATIFNVKQRSQAKVEEKKQLRLEVLETFLNCAYFSAMIFFTFRLKGSILTFFDEGEKRIVIVEWILGFLVYLAFLTLSRSGSILQNLKDLFVG